MIDNDAVETKYERGWQLVSRALGRTRPGDDTGHLRSRPRAASGSWDALGVQRLGDRIQRFIRNDRRAYDLHQFLRMAIGPDLGLPHSSPLSCPANRPA
jgi:hypothetical protein